MNLGGDVRASAKTAAAGSLSAAETRAAVPAENGRALSPGARILLWDFERGSLAYDLICLFLALLLLAVPAVWWGDPMIPRP